MRRVGGTNLATAAGRVAVAGACLALALLAGCQTIVEPSGPGDRAAWQERLAALETLQDWRLEGRIGVATERRGGSATLAWRQQGETMSLTFSGPFGVSAVRLSGTPNEMRVRDSKGREWVTDSPETALERSLGWPIPLASLRYWVTGRPAPGAPYRLQLSRRGLVVRLEQQGWTVRYEQYVQSGGFLLPLRLAASRPGGHVKLIVSQWTLPAKR